MSEIPLDEMCEFCADYFPETEIQELVCSLECCHFACKDCAEEREEGDL